MTEQRRYEFDIHLAERGFHSGKYNKEMYEAKVCEAMMQYNKTLTEPEIYLDQSYEELAPSLFILGVCHAAVYCL